MNHLLDELAKADLLSRYVRINNVEQSFTTIFEVCNSEMLVMALIASVAIETGLESEAQMNIQPRVDDMPASAALVRVQMEAAAAEVEELTLLTAHKRHNSQQSRVHALV